MSQIPGTNVASKIVPFDTADTFATHEDKYGVGGYRTVTNVYERNVITEPRQKIGMLVYVESEDKVYKLTATGTPPLSAANWAEFTLTSGITASFLDLSDTPNSYAGAAGQVILVKNDQTGLEFGNPTDQQLRTEVSNISAYLQSEIGSIPLSDYTLRTETSDISGYLNNRINGISLESTTVIGGTGISVIQSPPQTFSISVSGNYATISQVSDASGNAYNQAVNLLETDIYNLDVSLTTLVSNTSGNLQQQISSFNIVQGSNITVYEGPTNTWTISAAISGGGTDHNTLANLQGGTPTQYYHITADQYSDLIGKTEVTAISGYLQSEINAISPIDPTLILGGNGIQVIESPADTFTVSVSGDYATTTYVNSASANALTQAQSYVINQGYITRTETSNISGYIQSEINAIPLSDYTLKTETSAVSGYLNDRINGISPVDTTRVLGGNGIQVVELPNDTFTVSVSGNYATLSQVNSASANALTQAESYVINQGYITRTETSDISGYLNTRIDSISAGALSFVQLTDTPNTYPTSGQFVIVNQNSNGLEFIDFRAEVENISANLGAGIYQNTIDIQNINFDISTINTSISNHETRIDIIETNTANLTAGLGTLLVGVVPATSTNKYTITHPATDINQSVPVVSLTVPNSGSTIYVEAITNRTSTSFDVILSGTPTTSGYAINYQLNMAGNAFIVKYYSVGTLTTPIAQPNAALHDNFYLLLDQNSQINLPTNMVNGQSINIMIEQDDVGSHELVFDSGYKYTGGISSYTMTPSAYGIDILTILKISDRHFISAVQNFS